MVTKKKTIAKVKKPVQKPKTFEHLNDIMVNKTEGYYDNLSDKDKKEYSIYMLQRWLSMIPQYISLVNEVNPYIYRLSNKEYHEIMCAIIPKGKVYIQYIKKSEKKDKYDNWMVHPLQKLFLVSQQEAIDYIELLNAESIVELGRIFGIDKKEINKSIKNLNK